MHEYLDSQIAKEMRAIWPQVSDVDQHIGFLVAGVVPQQGNMQRVLVIGPHVFGDRNQDDTLIPVVLGGLVYNYVVFALCTHISYVERQRQYAVKARVRYDGRCLIRVMPSPYKAMAEFGEYRFPHIIVMPDADFAILHDYCVNYLHEDGVMVIAQRHPWVIDDAGLTEIWRKYLKNTEAGYCIETDKENAEFVVMAVKHG